MSKCICPDCGQTSIKVIDSRPPLSEGSWFLYRRRRECLACKKRFTTYEIMADDLDGPTLTKLEGRTSSMDRIHILAQQITEITAQSAPEPPEPIEAPKPRNLEQITHFGKDD
jgi:transcriptional regulator NrdR family protein